MNFDQLQSFVHVAELGSFTAAAEKAALTQPAVSLQIKLLERRLGVRLIERVGRRAQPTPAGIELLTHARRIIQELADAEESMVPHRSGVTGRVRIGSGATAFIHLLPLAISKAKARMPGLDITVRIGNADDILRDLEANSLDLAVVTMPASGRSLEVEAFYEDELMAVAPKGAEMPAAGPDPAFLSKKTLLVYEGGNTRRSIEEWMSAGGIRLKPAMEFGSVEAIKELVAAGLGWSILPGLSLKRDRTDFLEACPVRPKLVRRLGIVVRRDKHLTRGLREVIKALRETKAASPSP